MEENRDVKEYFGWDVYVWGNSLKIWDQYLKSKSNAGGIAIEVAANKGGLSAYLYNNGFNVICTDINRPDSDVIENHKNIGVEISYEGQDARRFTYDDGFADVVIFKSFLGYLSESDQRIALAEIHRILKPGGILLFAENLEATKLHSFIRRKFVRWGTSWNYVKFKNVTDLFKDYDQVEYNSFGFFSLFFPWSILKPVVYLLDCAVQKIVPQSMRYVLAGVASKKS